MQRTTTKSKTSLDVAADFGKVMMIATVGTAVIAGMLCLCQHFHFFGM